jgi:rhamnogalacturonan endolyase
MKRKFMSVMLAAAMFAGTLVPLSQMPVKAEGTVQTQETETHEFAAGTPRKMEYLNRGLVAIRVSGGIYLSWRLLGTEQMNQTFDIYRNGTKIRSNYNNTNFTDDAGFSTDFYQVVPTGETRTECDPVSVWDSSHLDIPIDKPADGKALDGTTYTYSANDASAADLDGDGEYEIILKWDPSNAHDNSQRGYTGNVYIDAYKLDGTKLWRVDLGVNIRAGAHYTQFLVYDFDGDGKAELVCKTAPGSVDGQGAFVSKVGDTEEITKTDNAKDYRTTKSGKSQGMVLSGPEYLTIFNGQNGAAMQTIDYTPARGSVKSWGDSYGNRSERYLACVAYLNGVTPSIVMTRGYYARAALAAYDWDGSNLKQRWLLDTNDLGNQKAAPYGQGTHSISVSDVDEDGKDEIIFGSATIDDNGTALNSTGHGHGDALHVSDFNNDGKQEVYMVHEDAAYYKEFGAELRDAATGAVLQKVASGADTGRGLIADIDPDHPGAEYWSSANSNLYSSATGAMIQENGAPRETNFAIWWDGDTNRELLDRNRIVKYKSTGGERLETFEGIHSNNSTKATPSLSADLFGDWREEVIFPTEDDTALRVFMSTTPSDVKLTTLMHDSQYRMAIAWQNVGYNQPPHTSYYIGSDMDLTKLEKPNITYAHVPEKVPGEETTPDEELKPMIAAEQFDKVSGNWGFVGARVVKAEAPYQNALSFSGGTSTKALNLPEVSAADISVESFTLGSGNKATAVVKNQGDTPIDPVIVTAAYDKDGLMTGVKIKKADEKIASSQQATIVADPLEKPQNGQVKAMIWKDAQSAQPLVKQALTEENQTVSNTSKGGNTVDMSFAWKVGTTNNSVKILNEQGQNIFTLSKASASAPIQYQAGTDAAQIVDASLTQANHWYHVNLKIDLASKLVDCSIQDYTTLGAGWKYVYCASFASTGAKKVESMQMTGAGMLDNVSINKVKYNVERGTVEFDITKGNAPFAGAKIEIDGKTLVSDQDGKAMIMLGSGSYDYKVEKEEHKTETGTIQLSADGVKQAVTMRDGDKYPVTIQYKDAYGLPIADSVEVGTVIENTTYTVSEEHKKDIEKETGSIGEKVLYEYDPDATGQTAVNITGNTDIVLVYKEKRTPTVGIDKEILSLNFGENGYGTDLWKTNSVATSYLTDEIGTKYMEFADIGSSRVEINIPKPSSKFVVEYDIAYGDLGDVGGNLVGLSAYSGNNFGNVVGLRRTKENDKWQTAKAKSNSQFDYLGGGNVTGVKPEAPGAWQNKFVHAVLVFSGQQMYVTLADKMTGTLYIDNEAVTLLSDVGTSSKLVNKLVFERKFGSGNATIGLSGLKIYQPTDGAVLYEDTQGVRTPSETVIGMQRHVADMEGMEYDAGSVMTLSYELVRDGVVVPSGSDTGITLNQNGTVTVDDSVDIAKQYKVRTAVNDKICKVTSLVFLAPETVFAPTFQTGDLNGFDKKEGSKTTLVAEDGVLKFEQDASNGGREFYRVLDEVRGENRAKIGFDFNNGGSKNDAGDYYSGYEYEIQFLNEQYDGDAVDENIMFALYQPFVNTKDHVMRYYTTDSSQKQNYGTTAELIWGVDKDGNQYPHDPAYYLDRSVTTLRIEAEFDFVNHTMDINLIKQLNADDQQVSIARLGSVPIKGNGLGGIRFVSKKTGSTVTWKPTVSNFNVSKFVNAATLPAVFTPPRELTQPQEEEEMAEDPITTEEMPEDVQTQTEGIAAAEEHSEN